MNVTCKVDMTGFNRGFALANQFTRKTPEQACNYTGKEVAFAAYQDTPFVTIPVIDAQLEVIEAPVIGKRGKPLKRKKQFVGNAAIGVPLAALIIQARANPNSRYNQLTGGRYALTASPFKGVSREAGRAAMALMIDIMTKERHKSGHFIAAGWLPSIRILKALVSTRLGGKARVSGQYNDQLGTAIPAKAGESNTSCVIENDVGLEGLNGPSHNRALMTQGTPALQRALDTVGQKEMNYALSKMGREDLEIPVNKAWL